MPYSTSKFKAEINRQIISKFPSRTTTILDIGAGAGCYSDLLKVHYPAMDAVEIRSPYIAEFALERKYRGAFNRNALDLFRDNADLAYDVAVLGDVLEHFEVADAIALVEHCAMCCSYVIAVVPVEAVSQGVERLRHM